MKTKMQGVTHPITRTGSYFFKKIVLLCTLILVGNTCYAQQITFHLPAEISVCKENQFSIEFIPAAYTPFMVSLLLDLTTDDDPLHGKWDKPCVPGGLSPEQIIIEILPNASYTLAAVQGVDNSWTISNITTIGVPITIEYKLKINCSVFDDTHLVQMWMNDLSVPFTDNITDAIPVNQVHFTNQSPSNNNFIAYYKNDSETYFSFKNDGATEADIDFKFEVNQNCAAYTIGDAYYFVGEDQLTSDITGWILFSSNSWQTISVQEGHNIYIKQLLSIEECIDDCDNEHVTFSYRCTNYNGGVFCDFCQPAQNATSSFTLFKGNVDKVTVERMTPHLLKDANWDLGCANENKQWTYRFKNEGVDGPPDGTISEVYVNFYYGDGKDRLTLSSMTLANVDLSHCPSCILTDDGGNTVTSLNVCNNCFDPAEAGESLCNAGVTDPFESLKFRVKNLAPGDYFDFNFKLYRCVENNMALMNHTKTYNHWKFDTYWLDECNPTHHILAQVDTPFNGATYLGISNQSFNGGPDVDMTMTFDPEVSDLTVQKGTTVPRFGPKGDFEIEIDKIFSQNEDFQLVGAWPWDGNAHGVLLAKIHCDQGLVFSSPIASEVSMKSAQNILLNLAPDYAYSDSPLPNQCTSADYYFYFDLNDASIIDISDVAKFGRFNFSLQSCCSAPATSTYTVEFYLLLDPTGNCQPITWPAAGSNTPPTCSPNACAWLPLSSTGNQIHIHCPGCVTPGIIVDKYKIQRETFGYEDANNDGIADGATPTVIEAGQTYYNSHLNDFAFKYSTHNDKIGDRLIAHLEPGDAGNGGYEYNTQMSQSPYFSFFNFLQLDRTISNANDMGLQVRQIDLYIDAPDDVNYNCIDCEEFGVPAPSSWRTQRKLSITGSALPQYFQQTVDQFFFSFGRNTNLGQYNTYDDGTFQTSGFFEGQQYRLYVQYDVCGNFESASAYKKEADIENSMWVTGADQPPNRPFSPSSITALENLLWTFTSCTNCTQVNQTFADNYLFRCEPSGGRHFFISNYNQLDFISAETVNCEKTLTMTGKSVIGNAVKDLFPFEFRPTKFEAQDWSFKIPAGYLITNAERRSYLNKMNPPDVFTTTFFPFTGTTTQQGEFIFTKQNLALGGQSPLKCLNVTTTPASQLYSGDQKSEHIIRLTLEPAACTTSNPTILENDFSATYNDVDLTCAPATTTVCTPSLNTVELLAPAQDILLEMPEPDLVTTITGSPIIVSTHKVCLHVQIENASNDMASNVFLAVPSVANLPNLTNWSFIFSDGTSATTNGTIIQLGNLIGHKKFTGDLCAEYDICNAPEFYIYEGWNCDGYPTNLTLPTVCALDTDTIVLNDALADMQSNGINFTQEEFTLCEDFTMHACYKSTELGQILPMLINITTLDPGLIVNSVTLEECANGNPAGTHTSSLTAVGNTDNTQWTISDQNMRDIFPSAPPSEPYYLQDNECVCAAVQLTPGCSFVLPTLSLPDIKLIAESFCKEPFNEVVDFQETLTLAGKACSTCFTVTKVASPTSISPGPGNTVSFNIEVCYGDNNDGNDISANIIDVVPPGFHWTSDPDGIVDLTQPITLSQGNCETFIVEGYFDNEVNCSANTNTVTVTGNGHTETAVACVEVVAGTCTADAWADKNYYCEGEDINLFSTISTGGTNNTYSWTGPLGTNWTSTDQNPIISNGDEGYSGTYTVTITDGDGCTATATVDILIYANALATSNSPVCEGSSILLFSGVTAGQNTTYSWIGPGGYSSNVQDPVIPNAILLATGTYSVTVTNQLCVSSSSVHVLVTVCCTADAWADKSYYCEGENVHLFSMLSTGGNVDSYTWTDPGGNVISTDQNFTIPNGNGNNSGTYTVTILDGEGCTATATVDILIYANALATSNSPVCEGSAILLFSGVTAGQYTTYSWTGPGGFTSNVQDPVIPNAILAATGTYSVTVNNQLCPSSSSVHVLVTVCCTADAWADKSYYCEGENVHLFSMLSTGGNVDSYTWTDPDGIFISDQQNFTIPNGNGNNSGTYTVTIIDGEGCTATATVDILIYANALATSNSPVCEGSSILLFSGVTAGQYTTYSWTGPNGFNSSVSDPVISNATLDATGTYTVNVSNQLCPSTSSVHVSVNPNPTAAISQNSSLCTGQSAIVHLEFTGTSPWNYSISDGSQTVSGTSSLNQTDVTIPTPTVGIHTYVVTSVTDASCASGSSVSGSAIVDVSSSAPASSVPILTRPAEACDGTIEMISCDLSSGQNIRYVWNTGSNASGVKFGTSATGPFSVPPFETSTNSVYAKFGALSGSTVYDVCVYVENGCGSSINECTSILGIASPPTSITGRNIVCSGQTSIAYSCSASPGASIYTWSFSVPGAVIHNQGSQNVSIDYPVFSSGQLCVTASLPCGGSSTSAPQCVNISNAPDMPGPISGAGSVCPGATHVLYSVSPVNGATGYNWVVPAGGSIDESPPYTNTIHVKFPAGFTSGNILVAAVGICGIASQQSSKNVTSNIPEQPGPITGPTAGVCNATVQYSIASVPGATSYIWTVPPAATSLTGQGTTSIQFNVGAAFTSGTVSVTANTNLCAPGVGPPRSITINGIPSTPGTITPNPTAWCTGQYVNFSVVPSVPLPTYTWTVSNGIITAGQGTSVITVRWATGSGSIRVSASNACGVSGMSALGASSVCRDAGLENSILNNISFYPNPSHSNITLVVNAKEKTRFDLKLIDMLGRPVRTESHSAEIGENNYNINLETISAGVYMIEIISADGDWKSSVIIE